MPYVILIFNLCCSHIDLSRRSMTYGISRTSGPSMIINTPRKVSPKSEFGLRKVGVSCLQSQTFMPINSEGSEMA